MTTDVTKARRRKCRGQAGRAFCASLRTGPIAVEIFRVIGAAMAEAGVVGIGRVTLSRRERPIMIEPRGSGGGVAAS